MTQSGNHPSGPLLPALSTLLPYVQPLACLSMISMSSAGAMSSWDGLVALKAAVALTVLALGTTAGAGDAGAGAGAGVTAEACTPGVAAVAAAATATTAGVAGAATAGDTAAVVAS